MSMTKLLVPSGTPVQDSCGETFSPTQFGFVGAFAALLAAFFGIMVAVLECRRGQREDIGRIRRRAEQAQRQRGRGHEQMMSLYKHEYSSLFSVMAVPGV